MTHQATMEDRFPLPYQIACLVLTSLFVWVFSVAREPRGWRRLFQSMFSKSTFFSVNRNKVIDATLKRYGIVVAMIILAADVTCFVAGVTASARKRMKGLTPDDRNRIEEMRRIQGGGSAGRGSGLE
jgi:hypothetical protein